MQYCFTLILYGIEGISGLCLAQHKILPNSLSASLRLFLACIIPPGNSLLLQNIWEYVSCSAALEKEQPSWSWQREWSTHNFEYSLFLSYLLTCYILLKSINDIDKVSDVSLHLNHLPFLNTISCTSIDLWKIKYNNTIAFISL